MRRRTLDLICCPEDGGFPLRMVVLEEFDAAPAMDRPDRPRCSNYCALKNSPLEPADPTPEDCRACSQRDIVRAILICPTCGRWFPIIDGVPQLLPDRLRNPEIELPLLAECRHLLDDQTLFSSPPYNLSDMIDTNPTEHPPE